MVSKKIYEHYEEVLEKLSELFGKVFNIFWKNFITEHSKNLSLILRNVYKNFLKCAKYVPRRDRGLVNFEKIVKKIYNNQKFIENLRNSRNLENYL